MNRYRVLEAIGYIARELIVSVSPPCARAKMKSTSICDKLKRAMGCVAAKSTQTQHSVRTLCGSQTKQPVSSNGPWVGSLPNQPRLNTRCGRYVGAKQNNQ
jgi:hypothetical protein